MYCFCILYCSNVMFNGQWVLVAFYLLGGVWGEGEWGAGSGTVQHSRVLSLVPYMEPTGTFMSII
jgi:hypothetical protein